MSFNIYIIFSLHDFVLQIIYQTSHKKKKEEKEGAERGGGGGGAKKMKS